MVCDQVRFMLGGESYLSQSIQLPWAPSVYQEVELKAIGGWQPFCLLKLYSTRLLLTMLYLCVILIPLHDIGCAEAASDYKWLSSDPSTVSVSAFGIVQAKKPGKAIVKVLSIYDSLNYDEVILLS